LFLSFFIHGSLSFYKINKFSGSFDKNSNEKGNIFALKQRWNIIRFFRELAPLQVLPQGYERCTDKDVCFA